MGAEVVAISVDEAEDSNRLAGTLGLTFPLLSDPDLAAALSFGVAMEGQDIAVPSVFIVGKDGRIHYRYVGESVTDRPTSADLIDAIKKIEGT